MASAERFGIYPASFVHAGGTLDLSQIERVEATPNPTIAEVTPGGAVDPAAYLIASGMPECPFATRDLATLLGTVALTTGLKLTGAATLRFQERTDCGTFETGLTHETITATGGFINVQSISAEQESPEGAIAQLNLLPLWDGSTEPLVHNTGVNFATAPSPAFNSRFFLGPCYHNSAQLDGVIRASFEPGIAFKRYTADGDPYPKKGAIMRRSPIFRFTMTKLDDVSALQVAGRAITNSFAMYFWKATANGTRVAVGTTEHIKISCSAGLWRHDRMSVQGNDDGTVDLIVRPTGTVSLSTASAIP